MFWILNIINLLTIVAITTGAMFEKGALNKKNLTSILWAHAVNSQKELHDALNGNIDMIEADIVLGKLITDPNGIEIPIMGHPPQNISNLSLEEFLEEIDDYNKDNTHRLKGVKLDFKSIEVFKGSIEMLRVKIPRMKYPIWLNADIIKGPVNATNKEVDAQQFLTGCKEFNTAVLSLGWTTQWGPDYKKGSYLPNQINEMIAVIKENNVLHDITFPVRAGIAALSFTKLEKLIQEIENNRNVTLTIWSSRNDAVDIEKLRQLIFKFGLDKIYLDVPEEVSSKLNLNDDNSSSGQVNLSPFLNFSLISTLMLIASFAMHNLQIL